MLIGVFFFAYMMSRNDDFFFMDYIALVIFTSLALYLHTNLTSLFFLTH